MPIPNQNPKCRAGLVHAAVAEVCPILGVSIGTWEDRSSWNIAFRDDATDEQKAAGRAVLTTYSID